MTSVKRRTGILGVALLAALAAVVFTATAAAQRPAKRTFSNVVFSTVMSGICSFDVHVDAVVSGFEMDFFDEAGHLVMAQNHQVEQDTFTANGKTLSGLPFMVNLDIRFDSNGDAVRAVATGLVEKVPLPDGSLFVSAGVIDFASHPGLTFILTPDNGGSGNIVGFCAALAP